MGMLAAGDSGFKGTGLFDFRFWISDFGLWDTKCGMWIEIVLVLVLDIVSEKTPRLGFL
jgi:hypothetical protein